MAPAGDGSCLVPLASLCFPDNLAMHTYIEYGLVFNMVENDNVISDQYLVLKGSKSLQMFLHF